MTYTWARYGGYECSSQGDQRFSAFSARLPDGRSIEEHYQCDVKGYDPGGRNWRLGKGKAPLRHNTNLWQAYLSLWRIWAVTHGLELADLAERAAAVNGVLSDQFATSSINQAHALATLLNERKTACQEPTPAPANR